MKTNLLCNYRAREKALKRESKDLDTLSCEYSSVLRELNPKLVDKMYRTYREKVEGEEVRKEKSSSRRKPDKTTKSSFSSSDSEFNKFRFYKGVDRAVDSDDNWEAKDYRMKPRRSSKRYVKTNPENDWQSAVVGAESSDNNWKTAKSNNSRSGFNLNYTDVFRPENISDHERQKGNIESDFDEDIVGRRDFVPAEDLRPVPRNKSVEIITKPKESIELDPITVDDGKNNWQNTFQPKYLKNVHELTGNFSNTAMSSDSLLEVRHDPTLIPVKKSIVDPVPVKDTKSTIVLQAKNLEPSLEKTQAPVENRPNVQVSNMEEKPLEDSMEVLELDTSFKAENRSAFSIEPPISQSPDQFPGRPSFKSSTQKSNNSVVYEDDFEREAFGRSSQDEHEQLFSPPRKEVLVEANIASPSYENDTFEESSEFIDTSNSVLLDFNFVNTNKSKPPPANRTQSSSGRLPMSGVAHEEASDSEDESSPDQRNDSKQERVLHDRAGLANYLNRDGSNDSNDSPFLGNITNRENADDDMVLLGTGRYDRTTPLKTTTSQHSQLSTGELYEQDSLASGGTASFERKKMEAVNTSAALPFSPLPSSIQYRDTDDVTPIFEEPGAHDGDQHATSKSWQPGRATMDSIEMSEALDVYVSAVQLDTSMTSKYSKVSPIQLMFYYFFR